MQNVVDVTFGQGASKINAWAKTTASAFGISELSAKQYSGTMGAMLKSMGLTTDASLNMSQKITELAGDLASFYNLDVDDAFTKIRSGISGETEPLKQLGINMSVANLEAYAMSKGITTAYQKMSQADQALLRYNYLLSVTADAQGDFSRTSDSWANQVRILSLNFDSLKSNIGQLLITALTPLLKQLNTLIEYANRAASAIASLFSGSVATATAGAGSAMSGLSGSAVDAANDIISTGTAAEKAAKKVRNAFAAYDEINTLSKTKTDSGSSSDIGSALGGGAGAASGYSSALSDSLDSASAKLSSFFDPLVAAWDSKGKPLVDSIHSAFQKIKDFCGAIKLSFAEIWNNGTAQQTLELILSIVTRIFDTVGNVANAFTKAWKNASTGDRIIQNIADVINNVLYIVDDVGKAISDWWQSERGTSFASAITECFEKVTNAAKRISDALKEIWDNGGRDLFNNLQNIVGNIVEIAAIVIGDIADIYGDLVEWFVPDAESGLKSVNDKLSSFNDTLDWLKTDGRPILDGLAKAIVGVSLAIGAIKVVQLGYNIAVLTAALAKNTWAWIKNTAALVADKWESIQIAAMYAKDFVVSIGQTIASKASELGAWVASTAAKVADTVATTAATAATWLFNAALTVLTSPITLVVVAIGALIAIIVLCIKHWDEIKAAAVAAWDGIKATWEKVSNWFKTSVIDPIANFFRNLWTSITNIFNNVKTFFQNVFSQAWQAVKNVFSGVGSFFGGIWNTIKSKFTSIGTSIGNAIGGAFKKVVNSIISFAENTINGFIRSINRAIGIINKIPGVNISLIRELSIPKLATGGYLKANNPTLAVVGDNKREGEIITPESKIREQVKLAMQEIGAAVNNGTQTVKLQIELLIKYPDGRTVIKQINEAQIAEGRILLEI